MPFRFHHNYDSGEKKWLWVDDTTRIVLEGTESSAEQMRDAEHNIALEVQNFQLKGIVGSALSHGYLVMSIDELSKEEISILKYAPKKRWRIRSYHVLKEYVKGQGR